MPNSKAKIVWCFLNISDPLVAWETYRGVLISPDCYVVEKHPSISFWQLRFLKNISSIQSINELKLETIRQLYYPQKVSRFRGFYYFDNQSTALKAANLWGIDYFNIFCLTEVGIDPNSIYSKLDSNWITLYANKINDNDNWMHSYWKGDPCPDFDEPIWELLIITRGLIYNNELRMRAYESIKNNNPMTILPMLEQARLAAYLNSDLGHGSPYIIKQNETKYTVKYIMDMQDANNEEYLRRLKNYVKNSENHKNINFKDLSLIDKYNVFSVPDLRVKQFEFELNKTGILKDFKIEKIVHNYNL